MFSSFRNFRPPAVPEIMLNVVVAVKGVTRCGCFEDPCSMSRASMLTYTR